MRALAFFLLATLLLPAAAQERGYYEVIVTVPPLAGPLPLARNVSTIVNLRLWRTLHVPPGKNPRTGKEWHAAVMPDSTMKGEPLNDTRLLRAAREKGAQMTIWGYAQDFGNDVAAQLYLSVYDYPDGRTRRPELWTLKLSGVNIIADLPRRQIQFTPVLLRREFVKKYSIENDISLCDEKVRCKGNALGPAGFRGLEHSGDWSEIVTYDKPPRRGWIYLPGMTQEASEVTDFTGALLAIFRGDPEWAKKQLERMLAAKTIGDVRSAVRTDALLLRGMAEEQTGRSGIEHINKALAANPTSLGAIRYRVMAEISAALRSGAAPSKTLQETAKFVRERRQLFQEGDPWLRSVEEGFRASGL